MQLLPEGLYSGPAIIGWGEVCSYHGIDHYRWGTKEVTIEVTIGEVLIWAVAGISQEISYT